MAEDLTSKLLEMREELGIKTCKYKDYVDPNSDVLEFYKDDYVNIKRDKIMSIMDLGYIIPASSKIHDDAYVEKTSVDKGISYVGLGQAMCINSTKSKINLISKRNLNVSNFKFLRNREFTPRRSLDAIDDKKFYCWRSCEFDIKKFNGKCDGYELTIFNEKMQIEDRAFYIIFD